MVQLAVLSGKGGTGKTTIAASFSALARGAVTVDCDVDASNLHLVLQAEVQTVQEFRASRKAMLHPSKCSACGTCVSLCRFEAIHQAGPGLPPTIDPLSCEGCALCSRTCPQQAIQMVDTVSGHWFVSSTRYGPLVHARLRAGQGNSGKLVSLLRQKARELASERGSELIILDGPPGIGCPVLACLSGASMALLVVEPSLAAIHDLRRLLKVCQQFGVPAAVCVNKYDLDLQLTFRIEKYCKQKQVPLLARVPLDDGVVGAMLAKEPVVEYASSAAAAAIRELWSNLSYNLKG